jgi:hypothetical protein
MSLIERVKALFGGVEESEPDHASDAEERRQGQAELLAERAKVSARLAQTQLELAAIRRPRQQQSGGK